ATALGQGQFVFNNRIIAEGINAPFVNANDCCGRSSIGSPDWSVSLLGGPAGTPPDQLVPLDPSSTTFRVPAGSPTAGYVNQVTPVVPNVPAGKDASILLRVQGPNGSIYDLGPYTITLGGGLITPPNLPLGFSPITVCGLCPEPSTLALCVIGLS